MFGTLLESRARRERGGKGAAVSVVIHATVILLAVAATTRAYTAPPGPPDPEVIFVPHTEVLAVPPQPAEQAPPSGPVAPDRLGRAPVLEAPKDIPVGIPDIDLSAPETRAEDFAQGARRPGERPGGAPDAGTSGNPLFEFQVDKPVLSAGGCAPRFPEILKSANLEGEVLAQFVVDEQGRVVDGSFKVLKSTHELFTQAVRACLSSMKFVPAEAGMKKVSQLVQQPFVFALERR